MTRPHHRRDPSRAAELRDAGDLGGEALSGLTAAIRDVHGAIADRAFGPTGAASKPARTIHDGVSTVVYGAVGAGLGVGARLAGALAAAREQHAPPERRGAPLSASRGSARALAALNGFVGDRLAREGSALATEMAVRVDGRAVALHREALAAAFPQATGHVVVLLHGLGETEHDWGHSDGLRDALGCTPVALRYNTGLRIPDNGRRLALLLDELVEHWPTSVHRLDLVGHSMGGLVARSAAHRTSHPWTVLLRHIACLGSPHLGAPLEQGAALAERALAKLPELAPVARGFALRSAGIQDLRHGPARWAPLDGEACDDLRLPPQARCHVLSATLHADPRHPVSHLLGDLLVRHDSATGRDLDFERRAHAGGLTHFDLLHHPTAFAWLKGTLGDAPALPRGT